MFKNREGSSNIKSSGIPVLEKSIDITGSGLRICDYVLVSEVLPDLLDVAVPVVVASGVSVIWQVMS
jgi:hypothetical protein